MRTPSFIANSRTPSAFGTPRVRRAGQAATGEANCDKNTYHGVRFYNANSDCVDVTQDITDKVYNEYGYPIDPYGNPLISQPPALWYQTGNRGQAWVRPDSTVMLDATGAVIPGTAAPTVVPSSAASLQNCIAATGSASTVKDARGMIVAMPPGGVGCDTNGRPMNAAGGIIATFPAVTTTTSSISTPVVLGIVAVALAGIVMVARSTQGPTVTVPRRARMNPWGSHMRHVRAMRRR